MQSDNIQVVPKLLELDLNERLHEDVGSHVFGQNIDRFDVARGDSLMNEVEVDVDVLDTAMEGGILGQADSALVVAVESRWQ